jgi:capsular exopolysaccharide synthesis family protein
MDKHVVSLVDPDSYEAEQYRKLRYVLEEIHKGNECLVLGICSPIAGDGKSLTAINLAGALAQDTAADVLLIDVDLRRQSKAMKKNMPYLDLDGRGLMDAITNTRLSLPDVIQRNSLLNVDVISTGLQSIAPYEVLRSLRFGKLIEEARQNYDYVILDTPPIVPVSDCRVIAKWVDTFLMVVAANHTPQAMLEEALNLMGPEKMLGLIFNRCEKLPLKYYGYYGYGRPTAKIADTSG